MDMQTITQHAKDLLLKDKRHAPTLLIEREDDQFDIIILNHLEGTTFEKEKQFFSIARERARKRHWQPEEIQEVVFIVEAWMSIVKEGETFKHARPADDPQRTEVLLVSKIAVVPQKQGKPKLETSVHIIEMLCDGSGDLVDLLPSPMEMDEVHHYLLRSFMAGIASAAFSDKQLARMARGI